MKVFRLCGLSFVLGGVFLFFGGAVFAQQGASSASVARSRAITNSNPTYKSSKPARSSKPSNRSKVYSYYRPAVSFEPPDEVAVEEFVNYHKHRLPLPKAGQAVAMDVRWGNDEFSRSRREAVLQIGFTTAEVTERTDLRPINLSLVIDKSGSMADGDKMSRVKESLQTLIGKLRADDIISIVVFDSYAEVLCPAERVGDGRALRRAISEIQSNGSTNLHGGLMLGYKEALKNFRKDATNRVILLTDGIANVGVTEPAKIAAESSEFNGQGIDLSTIGVGLELNNDLLRTLAQSGRGLYHFVADYQDIQKVFVNEVQSLVSSVAKNVKISVEYDPNLEIEQIYGYAPRRGESDFSINLDDMNNSLTQVVMTRFRVKNGGDQTYRVKARLSYFDVKRKKQIEDVQEIVLRNSGRDNCPLLADAEVKKNYTIAELAQSLAEMTAAFKNGRHREAENLLDQSSAETRRRFPNMEDKDVRYMLDIIENYRADLRNFNRSRGDGDCGKCQ